MKFILFVFVIFVAVASAQFGYFKSGVFGPPAPNFQAFAPLVSGNSVRDPRQNRGPVVFPPSPPGNPDETSGVVVGASGYGFVPPSGQGFYRFYHTRFFYK